MFLNKLTNISLAAKLTVYFFHPILCLYALNDNEGPNELTVGRKRPLNLTVKRKNSQILTVGRKIS